MDAANAACANAANPTTAHANAACANAANPNTAHANAACAACAYAADPDIRRPDPDPDMRIRRHVHHPVY